jgi:transcription termination/antitermination protein NusG
MIEPNNADITTETLDEKPQPEALESQAPATETLGEEPQSEAVESQAPSTETLDEEPQSEAVESQAPATETLDEEPQSEAVESQAPATDDTVEEQTPINPNFKWYVVHTYSGYENRAKKSLEERIKTSAFQDKFGEVLIPTENVLELGKGGQKKTTKRKFFPGYMLVQMELDDDSWHLVKGTPKITGFVGGTTRPPAVPDKEVQRLTQQIDEGTLKPKPRVYFEEGENVRVMNGPFANFNGIVETINEDKAKVRVLVSIFGRSTAVELDFIQVEKA